MQVGEGDEGVGGAQGSAGDGGRGVGRGHARDHLDRHLAVGQLEGAGGHGEHARVAGRDQRHPPPAPGQVEGGAGPLRLRSHRPPQDELLGTEEGGDGVDVGAVADHRVGPADGGGGGGGAVGAAAGSESDDVHRARAGVSPTDGHGRGGGGALAFGDDEAGAGAGGEEGGGLGHARRADGGDDGRARVGDVHQPPATTAGT